MDITIKRFDADLPLPTTDKDAAGFDFFCRKDVVIEPHKMALVPINCALQVPKGYALFLMLRSSAPWNRGLMMANGAGIVDPYFHGDKDELVAELYNFTDEPVAIHRGDKLVQGIFVKHEAPTWREVEHMPTPGVGYSGADPATNA